MEIEFVLTPLISIEGSKGIKEKYWCISVCERYYIKRLLRNRSNLSIYIYKV